MNIKPLVGAALASLVIDIIGNGIMPGPTKDANPTTKSNLIQYGVVGGVAAGVGYLSPGIVGATTSKGGAATGAALGAASLVGWAIGEQVSKQLGW